MLFNHVFIFIFQQMMSSNSLSTAAFQSKEVPQTENNFNEDEIQFECLNIEAKDQNSDESSVFSNQCAYEAMFNELKFLREQVKSLNAERLAAEESKKKLKVSNREMRCKVVLIEEHNKALQIEVQRQKAIIAAMASDMNSLRAQYTRSKAIIQQTETQRATLLDHEHNLKEAFERQLLHLQSELSCSRKESAEYEVENTKLLSYSQALEADILKMQARYQTILSENKFLCESNDELESVIGTVFSILTDMFACTKSSDVDERKSVIRRIDEAIPFKTEKRSNLRKQLRKVCELLCKMRSAIDRLFAKNSQLKKIVREYDSCLQLLDKND